MNSPNTPPLPPDERKSFTSQAALASLACPLIAVAVSAVSTPITQPPNGSPLAKLIIGGVCVLLILAGFVFAIIAFCGLNSRNQARVLGFGISGLAVNLVLICFMVVGLVGAAKRAANRRKVTTELKTTSKELQQNVRESYDPEQGITNFDSSRLDRMGSELKNASQKLSGDDATLMKVMGHHVDRMQTALKSYEAAMKPFRDGELLNVQSVTNKTDFAARREIVHGFLAANAKLKQVIADSAKNLRADLDQSGLSQAKIESVMKGFLTKAVPRNAITLKIRDCDQRLGDATIGALDLFETNWGNWRYDTAVDKIRFKETKVADAYNNFLDEIKAAAEEQVRLQGKLVALP